MLLHLCVIQGKSRGRKKQARSCDCSTAKRKVSDRKKCCNTCVQGIFLEAKFLSITTQISIAVPQLDVVGKYLLRFNAEKVSLSFFPFFLFCCQSSFFPVLSLFSLSLPPFVRYVFVIIYAILRVLINKILNFR